MKAGETTWSDASAGMTLEPGDRIKTGADSSALITLFEGSTIELEADTEIGVTELSIAEDTGSTTVKLWQEIGKTKNRVEKLVDPASRYDIETPAGAAVVRGSDGDLYVLKNGGPVTMWLYNRSGSWWLIGQGVKMPVDVGGWGTVAAGGTPSGSSQGPSSLSPSSGWEGYGDGGGGGGGSTGQWQTWTQTMVGDFCAGIINHNTDNVTIVDIGGGDGTVKLDSSDQSDRICPQQYHNVYGSNYQAQTFRAGATGNLTKVDLYLAKVGVPNSLIVELRNCVTTANVTKPGTVVHSSLVTDNVSSPAVYDFLFSSLYGITAGTDYSLVLRQQASSGNVSSCYRWYEDTGGNYPNGMVWQSSDNGTNWDMGGGGAHDFYFATYVEGHYRPSGVFASSSYDCGGGANFGTISWDNTSSPGVAELRFQISTSRNGSSWTDYVGPDGASSTYYETSPYNVWRGHNTYRYIRYRIIFSAQSSSILPEVKEVRITYYR